MRNHSRRALAASVGVLLLAAGAPTPAQAAAGAAKGPGFTQSSTGARVGSFVVRDHRAYKLKPLKRTGKKYRRAATLRGPKRARAAWIMSVYGQQGTRVQAAAVDVAVQHVLRSKRYRLGGKVARARLRATGEMRPYVVAYAKQMIRESASHAGRVRVTLDVGEGSTPVGSGRSVSVTVVDRAGGLSGRRVVFKYGSQRKSAFTSPTGVAIVDFETLPGVATVSAQVMKLPASTVTVWRSGKKTSPLLLSRRVSSRVFKAEVTGASPQSVSVAAAPTTYQVNKPIKGSYTVVGGSGTRSVTRKLIGPYSTTDFTCASSAVKQTSTTSVDGEGTFPLPTLTPAVSGYYKVAVEVAANPTTPDPASGCSEVIKVRKATKVLQERVGTSYTVTRGKGFNINVQVSGMDRVESHQLWANVYGPFTHKDQVKCVEGRKWRTVVRSVSGNGKFSMPAVTPLNKDYVGKFFAWKTRLSGSDLLVGDTSGCGVLVKVVDQ